MKIPTYRKNAFSKILYMQFRDIDKKHNASISQSLSTNLLHIGGA